MPNSQKLYKTDGFCTGIGIRIRHSKIHLCSLLSNGNHQQVFWQKNILCFSSNTPSLLYSPVNHLPGYGCPLNPQTLLVDWSIQHSRLSPKKVRRGCLANITSQCSFNTRVCSLLGSGTHKPGRLSSDLVLLFD